MSGELRKSENAVILRKLRTAILRGIRPTALLLHKQPHSKWDELDFLLLEAYQIFEDESSSSSGYPIWLTRSLDPQLQFVIEEFVDLADAALAEWDEAHQGKKAKKGATRFVRPVDILTGEAMELSGLARERFQTEAMQLTMEIADGVEIDLKRPEGGWDPGEYGDGTVVST